jgi:hypothetical protein
MNPRSPVTRALAFVCALCPFCNLKRRFPRSAYAGFMRRVERGCPFCKAYDIRAQLPRKE